MNAVRAESDDFTIFRFRGILLFLRVKNEIRIPNRLPAAFGSIEICFCSNIYFNIDLIACFRFSYIVLQKHDTTSFTLYYNENTVDLQG